MWLPKSFRKWFSRRRNTPIQKKASRNQIKLKLEVLEDRLAPAFTLSGTDLVLGIANSGDLRDGSTMASYKGVDAFFPGTPTQEFVLKANGTSYENFTGVGSFEIPGTTTNTSSGNTLAATFDGSVAGLQLQRRLQFERASSVVAFTIQITNTTGATINGVRFLEGGEPDQGADFGGGFPTQNDVLAVGGGTLVRSTQPAGTKAGYTVGFGSRDHRAFYSAEFPVNDPDAIIGSPVDPNGAIADIGIAIAFDFGNLVAGQTVFANYFFVYSETQAGADSLFAAAVTTPVVLPGFEVRTVTADGPFSGNHLTGMEVDPSTGDLYVAYDTGTVAAPPATAFPNFNSFTLYRVTPAGATSLVGNYPRSQSHDLLELEWGPDGKIYFQNGNQIQRINPADGTVSTYNSNTSPAPGSAFRHGLEFDPSGNLIYMPEAGTNSFYRIHVGTGATFLGSYASGFGDHGDDFGIQPDGDYVIYPDNFGKSFGGNPNRVFELDTTAHVDGTPFSLSYLSGTDINDLGNGYGHSNGTIDPLTGDVYTAGGTFGGGSTSIQVTPGNGTIASVTTNYVTNIGNGVNRLGSGSPNGASRGATDIKFGPRSDGAAGESLYIIDDFNNAVYEVRSAIVVGPFVYTETAGGGNFVVRQNGANVELLRNNVLVDSRPLSSITTYTINGQAGVTDTLTVDYAFGGFFSVLNGTFFNAGGDAGDAMTVQGASATNVTHTFVNAHDGSVNIDGTMITYTGLAPILDTITATTRTFAFTGGSETVTVSDDGTPGNNMSTIDSTLGESVTFTHPTNTLTIDTAAGTGTDVVEVSLVDSLTASDLHIQSPSSIRFDNVVTSGQLFLTAGEITELNPDAGVDVTAGEFDAVVSVGIGVADTLETALGAIEATTDTGGIYINNTGALTIGGFDGGIFGVQLLSGGTGDIHITASGTIDASQVGDTISNLGTGNTTVIATGPNSDIRTGNNFLVNIFTHLGNIVIEAGRDLLAGFGSGFGSIRANDGTLQVTAGRDISLDNQANVFVGAGTGALTMTAGRHITMGTGSPSVFPGPGISTQGGEITITAANNTAGGTLTTNNATLTASDVHVISSNGPGAADGNITINADNVIINTDAGIDAGAAVVTIRQMTAGRQIALGGDPGTLSLDDAELDQVTAGRLVIGRTDNVGDIISTAAITQTGSGYLSLWLLTGGAVRDTTMTETELVVHQFILINAASGIGAAGADDFELDAAISLDVLNSTSGGIFITDVANGLNLNDIDLDGFAVSGVGGGGTIVALSPLTISADAITTGGMTYTATDSITNDVDHLTVNAGVLVQDDVGLTLNAGDNLNIIAGSTVQVTGALGALALNIDAGNNDSGGETALINGIIDTTNGSLITLTGGSQDDQFFIGAGGGPVDNIQSNLQINGNGHVTQDFVGIDDTNDASQDTVNVTNDDPGVGGDSTVSGMTASSFEINDVEQVHLFFSHVAGSANGDNVTIEPNEVTRFDLFGRDPTGSPGDLLNYVGSATKTFSGPNSGTLSQAGFADVNFSGFESITATGSLNDNIDLNLIDPSDAGTPTPNSIRIVVNDIGGTNFFQVFIDTDTTSGPGEVLFSSEIYSAVTGATVTGNSADDRLIVDHAGTGTGVNGGFLNRTITFDGNGGSDSLSIQGTPTFATPASVLETYRVGATQDAGTWVIDPDGSGGVGSVTPGADGMVITFTGLEPVDDDTAVANFDVFLADVGLNADDVSIVNGGLLNSFNSLQVTDNGGTFETFRFANKTNVTINGRDGADLITADFTIASDGLETFALYGNSVTVASDDNVGDTLNLVNAATLGGANTLSLNGDGGGDSITVGNTLAAFGAGGSLAGVLSNVSVDGGGSAGDQLNIDDSGDATARTFLLTNSTFNGTGFFANGITSYSAAELVQIELGSNDDTINIQSTATGSSYNVNANAGNDSVNISSDAPTNTGDIDAILGAIAVNTGADTDTLVISDLTSANGPKTYGVNGVGPTTVSATGSANIQYDANGAQQLENFTLSGNRTGGTNIYNIGVTTGLTANTINDGDATGSGNSQFQIQADALQAGASSTFNGFAGNDTFNVNYAATATSAATTFAINGGAPAADVTNEDIVNINTNQASDGARTVGITYQSVVAGNVDVSGLGTTINITTTEQISYTGDDPAGASLGDDSVTVTDTASIVDPAQVIPGPSGATYSRNGGVVNLDPGPDLSLAGLAATNGLLLDGDDPTSFPGDRLVYFGVPAAQKQITGINSGVISAPGVIDVAYTDYERVQTNSGNVFNDLIDLDNGPLNALGGEDGNANTIRLERFNDANGEFLRIYIDFGDGNGEQLFSTQLYVSVNTITVTGGTDVDRLIVDHEATGPNTTALNSFINRAITFNANGPDAANNAGGDSLAITGNPGFMSARTTYLVGASEDAGRYVIDPDDSAGPGATGVFPFGYSGDEMSILFTGLEPIDDDTPAGILDVILSAGVTPDQAIIENAAALNTFAALSITDNNSTFESTRFTRKDTVRIMGNTAGDAFHVNFTTNAVGSDGVTPLGAMEIYGHLSPDVQAALGVPLDDNASDVVQLDRSNVPALNIFGQGGSDLVHNSPTPGPFGGGVQIMDQLFGTITIDMGAGAADQIALLDRNDATADNINLTNTQIDGYNGVFPSTNVINYSNADIFRYVGTGGGDTIDVLSTAAGTSYYVTGGNGADTVTIGNQTADYGNVFDGSLDAILGEILVSGEYRPGGVAIDTLNIDDSGTAALADAATMDTVAGYTFVRAPFFGDLTGAATVFTNFAGTSLADTVPIRYYHQAFTATGGNRMEFVNVQASTGDDIIYVNATTATTRTILEGREGDDLIRLEGENLSAANEIYGDENPAHANPVASYGNDDIVLNIDSGLFAGAGAPGSGDSIGSTAFATITGLLIHGNDNAVPQPNTVNRDSVIVNDRSGVARTLDYLFLNTQGDINVDAATVAGGLFGANLAGGVLQIRGTETYIFNDNGESNDNNRIFGSTDDGAIGGANPADDDLIVALLPTSLGSGKTLADGSVVLPNGVLAASSAIVYRDGTPYVDTPPVALLNPANLPGMSGGGIGPDLLLNGISNAVVGVTPNGLVRTQGITLDGNGNAGAGDRALVYAASENPLVEAGNATDIFGLGAGVLQSGFGANGAYDNAFVDDSSAVTTNLTFGSLVTVNLNTASFVNPNLPHDSTETPALVYNAGDEAAAQANNIADDITAAISTNFNIQVNGNQPGLTFAGAAKFSTPRGDQLAIIVPAGGSLNIFSDNQTPVPNVSVGASNLTFVLRNSSIERLSLDAGPTGRVNLIGDNNDPTVNQNDYFRIRGRDVDSGIGGDANGANELQLEIGGNWNPTTGAVNLSPPIFLRNVTRLNVSGGEVNAAAGNNGYDAFGNAIPVTTNSGVDVLDITPYADNTPLGWGVETYFNEGDELPGGPGDGGVTAIPIDLVIFNGVSGVSENIVIQPSSLLNGQVFSTNAATGTSIAVVNYLLNSNIIINGSSPSGTVGDTDTLTVRSTDPANPGTSGNDDVIANFTAAGTAAAPLVRIYDAGAAVTRPTAAESADTAGVAANVIFNLQNFTNINTINFDLLGGSDYFQLLSGRVNGSLTINVDGGNPSGVDTVEVDGVNNGNDTLVVTSGANNGAGTIEATNSGATGATTINFSATEAIAINAGGGTGTDQLTINGTGGDDAFTLVGTAVRAGNAQVNAGPTISLAGLGSTSSDLTLNGLGGDDSFAVTHFNGWGIDDVNINGGPPAASDSFQLQTHSSATQVDDTIAYSASAANAGQLDVTSSGVTTNYILTDVESAIVDAQGNDGPDILNVTTPNAVITLGDAPGSGLVQPVDLGGQNLLALAYVHVEQANVNGATAVIQGTSGNDTIRVDATTGIVTVTNLLGFDNSVDLWDNTGATGFTRVVVNGLGGDDAITIVSGALFANGIHVVGGEPNVGSDSVTVADASATIDFSTNQITGVAGGAISLLGIETVNVNGADSVADAYTVNGYGATTDVATLNLSGGDIGQNDNDTIAVNAIGAQGTIRFTPLTAGSARLELTGNGPTVNITGFNDDDDNLSLDAGPNLDALEVFAPVGNDRILVTAGGLGTRVTVTAGGNPAGGTKWVPLDFTSVDALTIFAGAGDDLIDVTPSATTSIFVDGGDPIGISPGDTLVLNPVGFSITEPGPERDEGGLVNPPNQRVSWDHIERVVVAGGGPALILGTNGDDDITIIARDASYDPLADGVQDFTASVNNGAEVLYLNHAVVLVDALAGDDDIVVREPAPAPAGPWNVQVYVAGGTPAAPTGDQGDVLEVETSGTQTASFTPNPAAIPGQMIAVGPVTVTVAPIAGGIDTAILTDTTNTSIIAAAPFTLTVSLGVVPVFTYTSSPGGVEQVVYQGLAGADSLTINGTAVDDTTTVTPTGGTFRSAGGPAFDYFGANVTVTGGAGGFDTVNINGTAGADTVTSTASTVSFTGGGSVAFGAGVDLMNLSTLQGNDSITLSLGVAGMFKFIDAGADNDTVDLSAVVTDATILGGDGDDSLTGSPTADFIDGGRGNDTIFGLGGGDTIYGGEGNDSISGGTGADQMFGGDGSDIMTWNQGDGSDLVEGGNDGDQLLFIGATAAQLPVENFTLTATAPNVGAGSRLNLTRTQGAITMDVAGVEDIAIDAQDGADTFLVNDLFATDVRTVNFGLAAGATGADAVTVEGRNLADSILISNFTTALGAPAVKVAGLRYDVNVILPSLARGDTLRVNGNSGDDTIKADAGVEANIAITLDGGLGNDFLSADATLLGGVGNDILEGGAGIDTYDGGAGEDLLIASAGADILNGGADFDTFLIRGTADNDTIEAFQNTPGVAANSGYSLTWILNGITNVPVVTQDAAGLPGAAGIHPTLEEVRIEAGHGNDLIRVGVSDTFADPSTTNGVPNQSFRFHALGDAPNASDRLVVQDDGAGDLTVIHQAFDLRSGRVSVAPGATITNGGFGLADVVYEGIERVDITPLEPVSGATGTDGAGRIVVFHADPFEINDSRLNAGQVSRVGQNQNSPNIDPGGITTPFTVNGDEDWYEFRPLATNTYQVRILFDRVLPLANGRPGLPGNGDLSLDIYDANGAPIASGVADANGNNRTATFAATNLATSPFSRIFIRVKGAGNQPTPSINVYDFDNLSGAGSGIPGVTLVDIFGPQVNGVTFTDDPSTARNEAALNIFAQKPTLGPSPLVQSLEIQFVDRPGRAPGFTYPAIDAALFNGVDTGAMQTSGPAMGLFSLVGDRVGNVPIVGVSLTNETISTGDFALANVTLYFDITNPTFGGGLPDDRYTLTVLDALTDPAGNRLDGESNAVQPNAIPSFPSGNGQAGGNFVARFTVNSHPHIGMFGNGSQQLDINGNGIWDPNHADIVNADKTFAFGFYTDNIFAGDFAPVGVDGNDFDKLGAYGQVNGRFRFLLATSGVIDTPLFIYPTWQINGRPLAYGFNPAINADQIAIFDGAGTWYIDYGHDNNIGGPGTIIVRDGLTGYPIVGDFDGSGTFDLATYQPDTNTWLFDLHPLTNPGIHATLNFGFAGIMERPVADDMNRDGITDIGLAVPVSTLGTTALSTDWYFLESPGPGALRGFVPGPTSPYLGTINAIAHAFNPAPFSQDQFFHFGDGFMQPIVGTWDPPVPPPPPVLKLAPGTFTDVSVSALLDSVPDGGSSGLIARRTSNGLNQYWGGIARAGSTYTALIRLYQNGVWQTLASTPIPALNANSTLKFDVIGTTLELSLNGSLLLSAASAALQSAGGVGSYSDSGTVIWPAQATDATRTLTTLPFSDSFTQGNGTLLAPVWNEWAGSFRTQGNVAIAQAAINLATIHTASQADTSQSVTVSNVPANGFAGLHARYNIANDSLYRGGLTSVYNTSTGATSYYAQIWRRLNGAWVQLASNLVGTGAGTVTFVTVGSSQQLFLNGVLVAASNDAVLKTGAVGIYGAQGVSLDNYSAQAFTLATPTLPFADSFTTGPALGGSWYANVGGFAINGNRLVGAFGNNQATLNNVSQADSSQSVDVVSLPADGFGGLQSRLNASTDSLYRGGLTAVYNPATGANTYYAQIWRKLSGAWTMLASTPVAGPGTLNFVTVGSSQQLFLNGVLVAAANDTLLKTGAIGVYSAQGGTLDNYAAQAYTLIAPTLPFADSFSTGSALGANWYSNAGGFAVSAGRIVGALGNNQVTLFNSALTDSSQTVDVFSLPNDGFGGLQARVSAAGDSLYRGGITAVYNPATQTNTYYAQIWRRLANAWTLLASTPVASPGTLTFVTVGASQQLFLNGTLVAASTDAAVKIGAVGVYGAQGATLDNYSARQSAFITTNLPYSDSFSTGSAPAANWYANAGGFSLSAGKLTGVGATNQITLFGVSRPDVSVQAQIGALPIGQSAGLFARYDSATGNTYWAGLVADYNPATGGVMYSAQIYRRINGSWTLLFSKAAGTQPGLLRFDVVGTLLTLTLNGNPIGTLSDTGLRTAGTVGMSGSTGSQFSNFSAS